MSKRILLAVCGGIAAYKSAELLRLLIKQGAEVRVVMTRSAQQFITPLTFQALSGSAVHTELLDYEAENAMGHIQLTRWADLIIVAPASANTIAKFSHGLADDLLSTLYLAASCPVFIAPAMNQAMWSKASTQENIQRLKNFGNNILGPASGEQACGDTGPGRMLEAEQICVAILPSASALPTNAISVLISAGPTREPIDPVRYITNRSSGKMGYALAEAAQALGASVTLVSGPVTIEKPQYIPVVDVETAAQMHAEVLQRVIGFDIYIGAAAVADYTPSTSQTQKIKKTDAHSVLQLHKTADILADVAALSKRPFTVGFAAETDNLEQYALEKLRKKKPDLIAANWVGRQHGGFDKDQNALSVYWQGGRQNFPMMEKKLLATQLFHLILKQFNEKRTTENT